MKKIKSFVVKNMITDKYYLVYKYYKVFGSYLNLNNPKRLNEKIQWLKLYDRRSIHTLIADKIRVREYVKEKGLENLLIPLLKTYASSHELRLDDIPSEPCVIKANNDSGGVFLCRDKCSIDVSYINKSLKKSFDYNHYYHTKEWQYKNIKPAILIEKMLVNESGDVPSDYKVHCFNGKARILQIDSDRFCDHKEMFLDRDLNDLEFSWGPVVNGEHKIGRANLENTHIPEMAKNLFKYAEILAEEFPYCRIDFYICDDKVYFGEITLHHGSGFSKFTPDKYDKILGDMVKLESVNEKDI